MPGSWGPSTQSVSTAAQRAGQRGAGATRAQSCQQDGDLGQGKVAAEVCMEKGGTETTKGQGRVQEGGHGRHGHHPAPDDSKSGKTSHKPRSQHPQGACMARSASLGARPPPRLKSFLLNCVNFPSACTHAHARMRAHKCENQGVPRTGVSGNRATDRWASTSQQPLWISGVCPSSPPPPRGTENRGSGSRSAPSLSLFVIKNMKLGKAPRWYTSHQAVF